MTGLDFQNLFWHFFASIKKSGIQNLYLSLVSEICAQERCTSQISSVCSPQSDVINFINIFCARFLYESLFKAKT